MTSWALEMVSWDLETRFLYEVSISILYNDITTVEPSWGGLPFDIG